MSSRYAFIPALFLFALSACTPSREITYSLVDVQPVMTKDSTYSITRARTLSIVPFEDDRHSMLDDSVLFKKGRETRLYNTSYCINSEEHYVKDMVASQVSMIMGRHFSQRKTFRIVQLGTTKPMDFVLSGRLQRLYGEQEFSSAARMGSMFGLIGALATAGATTPGKISIEFSELSLRRTSDGSEKTLADIIERVSGELPADAYCWCIYDNVNLALKSAVERLAIQVERAVAEMEGLPAVPPIVETRPATPNTARSVEPEPSTLGADSTAYVQPEVVKQQVRPAPEVRTTTVPIVSKESGVSISVVQGDKIISGFRVGYNMLTESEDKKKLSGLGASLTYYDIENRDQGLKGQMLSFGGKYVFRFYFSSEPTSLFFGGTFELIGGNETIKYGSSDETTFFFGPTIHEVIGISLIRNVSLEFGAFQLAYFGSKMLPSDVGITGGINIGF